MAFVRPSSSPRRGFARTLRVLLVLMASALARPAAGEEVLAAVATNFADAAQALASAFEQRTGHRVVVSAGSTGKLYAQIVQGAPYHVLLAADRERPERLVAEGRAVAGSRFTYATGRLVLWSAEPGRIGGDPAAALTSNAIRHVAIANPELAPYGAAARETLIALGLWDRLSARIVTAENAGQAFAMVATGNAELGFVAHASLVAAGKTQAGERWDVPGAHHRAIRQDAVLLHAGQDHAAARAFLAFLRSGEALGMIERHGYDVAPWRGAEPPSGHDAS